MANTYKLIASSTVGSGGAANITFSSIDQTYTDLVLKMSLRQAGSSSGNQLGVRFNGVSLYYSRVAGYGAGNLVDTASGTSETFARFGFAQSSTFTANAFGVYEMYIAKYSQSARPKSFLTNAVNASAATQVYAQGIWYGLWNDNSAITSILIQDLSSSTNFAQYSTIQLYGISAT